MVKIKVFNHYEVSPSTIENEVNRWIAEVERRGVKIIQIAAAGAGRGGIHDGPFLTLWILYEE